MAESEASVSKAAKKNKKRHNKSKSGGTTSSSSPGGIEPSELVVIIKEQLAEAKKNKDHALAGKLRDQLWVVTDLAQGIKTDMPDSEYLKIIQSLPIQQAATPESTQTPIQTSSTGASSSGEGTGLTTTEKRIKTLNKKLQQIESLKEKQAKGEKLEKNQLDKIKSEPEINKEIEELRELLNTAL